MCVCVFVCACVSVSVCITQNWNNVRKKQEIVWVVLCIQHYYSFARRSNLSRITVSFPGHVSYCAPDRDLPQHRTNVE